MKKYHSIIVFLLFMIMAWVLLPIPPKGIKGTYNTWSNLYVCQPEACLHEIAHKMDDQAGFGYAISESAGYRRAIDDLGGVPEDYSYSEVYAAMFASAECNPEAVPFMLREFYDWSYCGEWRPGKPNSILSYFDD